MYEAGCSSRYFFMHMLSGSMHGCRVRLWHGLRRTGVNCSTLEQPASSIDLVTHDLAQQHQ